MSLAEVRGGLGMRLPREAMWNEERGQSEPLQQFLKSWRRSQKGPCGRRSGWLREEGLQSASARHNRHPREAGKVETRESTSGRAAKEPGA